MAEWMGAALSLRLIIVHRLVLALLLRTFKEDGGLFLLITRCRCFLVRLRRDLYLWLLHAVQQEVYKLSDHFDLVRLRGKGLLLIDVVLILLAVFLNDGHVLEGEKLIELVGHRLPVLRDQVYQAHLEFAKILDDRLGRQIALRRQHEESHLGHFGAVVVITNKRKVLDDLVEVHDGPIAEEPIFFQLLYLKVVMMVVVEEIAEFGRHLVGHVVVQLDIRAKLKLLVVVKLKLVMHVANAHQQLLLFLRLEPLHIKIACAIRRVELHVLGQPEAQVLAEELLVGAHERDVVLRPIQYLVLVVVVDVRVLDVLLVRVEVCSDWQQLALAYARPKIAINLLKYLRYLIAIRIRLKYAHDLLVREKQVVK